MPFIRVEMLSGRSKAQKSELAEVFTREMARIAKCPTSAVQIVFAEFDRADWSVGGQFTDTSEAV